MTADIMTDLRDTVDSLCDPHQIREPRGHIWDHNRHKKQLPDHVTVLPGLLQQLADIVYPGSPPDNGAGPTSRPVPQSRPPLRMDAASAHLAIVMAVTRWHVSLGLELRDTIESSVRQLLGRIATEDSDTQTTLLSEMRSWQRQAEIICGHRQPDPQLQVPCPRCGERRLRVNMADLTARCDGRPDGEPCGSRWAEQEDPDRGVYPIGVLARHIADHQRLSKEGADRARAEDRARKARISGKPAPAM